MLSFMPCALKGCPMAIHPAAVGVLCVVLAASAGSAQRRELRGPYEVVHGWPQMPEGRILGQATGVDVDSSGNVYVFHRSGRPWTNEPALPFISGPTVEVFEVASGRHLRSWGANLFVMPHGLTIDRQDNVWLTDVGLHQVFNLVPTRSCFWSSERRGFRERIERISISQQMSQSFRTVRSMLLMATATRVS